MRDIPNEELSPKDVPSDDADWQEILEFALTFDGYEYWGSLDRCAEVATARAHGTLTTLRTCLFFEQRIWRNGDESLPTKSQLRYWRSLVRKIRQKVEDSRRADH